jgi:hypothetical protein
VIGFPPSVVGASHDTEAEPSPAAATTPEGAPGTVAGVTALEGSDDGPVPAALIACTVNVYIVPLFNPVIVVLVVDPPTLFTAPPGFVVTV